MATLSDLYTHLKTLCEQWFYNKSTMDTYLGNKVDKITGKGLSTEDYTTNEKNKLAGIEAQANKTVVDSALSSTSTNPLQNKAINTALSNKADSSTIPTKTSDLTNDGADGTNVYVANNDSRLTDSRTPTAHSHYDADIEIYDNNRLTNISSLSGVPISYITKQNRLNQCIDMAFAQVSSIKALEVVSTLPTASASTMGMLYIINESNKINFYYTEYDEPHDAYDWHKMDTDILDELVVNWSDVQNKPSTFTPSSHTHGNLSDDGKIGSNANYFVYTTTGGAVTSKQKIGNINTDGKIGSTANLPLITGSNGVLTTGSFGTSANTFCQGNDSRLSDARTPTSHTHGNILNGGTITQTGTSGGNMVVTNSSNAVVVDTTINVIDALVQDLISYGSS